MAQHGLDRHVTEVLIFRNEEYRQRIRVQVEHLRVGDETQEANTRIVARNLAEVIFVFSGAGNEQRNVAGEVLHRAQRKINPLPAMQAAGEEKVFLRAAIVSLRQYRRI